MGPIRMFVVASPLQCKKKGGGTVVGQGPSAVTGPALNIVTILHIQRPE